MSKFHVPMAASCIAAGGVIAYPTEGVWGLGADPFNREAVLSILDMKKRSWKKGLILVGSDVAQFSPLLDSLPEDTKEKLLASWPGPNTWVVPDADFYPSWVRGEHDSVAIRVTAHPLVSALCRKVGFPIVSTSANPATRPPALSTLQARCYFGPQVDYYLGGSLMHPGQASTIRDARNNTTLRI